MSERVEAWLVERQRATGEWKPCHGGVSGTRFHASLETAEAEARAWGEDGYVVRIVPLRRESTPRGLVHVASAELVPTWDTDKIPVGPCASHPPGVKCMACDPVGRDAELDYDHLRATNNG